MAPGRLLLARARAQAGVLAVSVVLLLVASCVVTGVVAIGDARATAGLRTALAALPAAESLATVRARQGEDPGGQQDAVARTVEGLAGDAPLSVSRSTRSGLLGVVAPVTEGLRLVAVAYDDLPRHADLVQGAWPGAATEAALHADAAATLGVGPGDVLVVEGGDGPVGLDVVGTWRPADAEDPFFGGEELETTGVESPTVAGPVVLGDLVAAGLAPRPTVRWRVVLDADRVRPGDLAAATSAVQRLRGAVAGNPRVGADVQVSDALSPGLSGLSRRLVVARSASALPAVAVAGVAGAALLLVGQLLAAARADQTQLIRARGASGTQAARWSVAEGLALALPAALLAPPAAVALGALGGVGVEPAPWLRWTGAALAAGGTVLLLGPSVRDARRWSATEPARPGRVDGLRRGRDVVLVVGAVVGVWQLRRYGSGAAGGGDVDLLLVAAPALALLVGGVLATRLLAPLAGLGQHVAARRPALPGALVAWEVGRRPVAHGVATALVTLGVAAGVLAAGWSATWGALQADVAVAETGADVRAVALPGARTTPSDRAVAYAELDGVRAVTSVSLAPAAASSTSSTLVAVDGATASQTVRVAGTGPDGGELAALVRPDPAPWPGPVGDGQVTVAVSQRGLDAPGRSPDARAVVGAWFGGPDGSLVQVTSEPVDLQRDTGRTVTLDVPDAGAGPWSLVAVDLSVPAVPAQRVAYSLTVTSAGDAGGPGSVRWRELGTAVPAGLGRPTVEVPGNGAPQVTLTTPGGGPSGQIRTRLGVEGLVAGPVPAVVSAELAQAGDVGVGDVVTLTRQGVATSLDVRAVTASLPGVGGAAALTDLQALSSAALVAGSPVPVVDQWWLATGPGADPAEVVAAVRAVDGAPALVRSSELVAAELAADPLGSAPPATFGLALLATAFCVGTGLAVAGVETARRRRVELAVLTATGVAPGQVRRVLAAEQLAVAGVGVLAGVGLGASVAWLTLPSLVVPAGASVEPAVRLSAPGVAVVLLAVLAAVAVGVGVASALWRRRPPGADVRLGADR